MNKQRAKTKHRKSAPQRTCVACRATTDKRALTRLVRTPDAGVCIDPTGKQAGRGAYLCDNPDCWERALQTDVLAKALRTHLTDADRERIRQAMPTATPE